MKGKLMKTKKNQKSTKNKEKTQTFSLSLTKKEITHLRDLMGVFTPLEQGITVSEMLAKSTGSKITERRLWKKIIDLGKKARVKIGENAPDYIVTVTGPSPLGVFKVEDNDVAQLGINYNV